MFHLTFGKSVPRYIFKCYCKFRLCWNLFSKSSFVGDTVSMTSTVIGLKRTQMEKIGVVYVHSIENKSRWKWSFKLQKMGNGSQKDHSVKKLEINIVPTFEACTPNHK